MNIYKISQNKNKGYSTFDSAVVIAEDANEARHITPNGDKFGDSFGSWCNNPKDVEVEFIGIADHTFVNGTVICASFNAG